MFVYENPLFPPLPPHFLKRTENRLEEEEREAIEKGLVRCPACCAWVEEGELRENGGICSQCVKYDI